MNYLRKILSAHLILMISFLLCSCGPQHSISSDVIYKGDNFSYNDLLNNGIVVGGIASQEINFTNNERIQYNSHFSTILIKQLKDVQIINTSQLMYKIGKENYFSIMEEFDIEQMLAEKDMQVFGESMPEITYIILLYIDDENIDNKSNTEYKEGKYETVDETTYSLTAEFQIYDLSQEQMIWNCVIFNNAVKTETRTDDGLLDVVVGDVFSGAFDAIDREEVLEEIYEKVTDDLAKIKN